MTDNWRPSGKVPCVVLIIGLVLMALMCKIVMQLIIEQKEVTDKAKFAHLFAHW